MNYNDKIYYLDSDYAVYDKNGEKVGIIGVNGLVINEENNLVYNGQVVGIIGGNLTDLKRANDITKERGNVRILKQDNNAGFGQIMIVTLVLLCLVLFVVVFGISFFS